MSASVLVLAQAAAEDTTSGSAAAIFGVFLAVGILGIFGIVSKTGRRLIFPLVAILLGASIIAGTIFDATTFRLSPITVIALFFGVLLTVGGLGALREGMVVPDVEGTDPVVSPAPPRITPDEK